MTQATPTPKKPELAETKTEGQPSAQQPSAQQTAGQSPASAQPAQPSPTPQAASQGQTSAQPAGQAQPGLSAEAERAPQGQTPQRDPTVRNLAEGEFIFEEGEVGNLAYVLLEGQVEICRLSGGEIVSLQQLDEGALFGEMALIDKAPRSASARALTDVKVREIDEKAFMAHIRKAPDVALNMMHRLADYVRSANQAMGGGLFSNGGEGSGKTAETRQASSSDDHGSLWQSPSEEIIDEFQSPDEALERRRLSPLVFVTFGVIMTLIVAVVLWASLSIIDTTLSARGRLTTSVPTISVQATDNSVVKNIHVAVGQHVKAGQVLVTLDETYAKADLARAEIEFNQLSAKIDRLQAEINQDGKAALPRLNDKIQREVFLNRLKEYTSRIASYDLDLESRSLKLETARGDVGIARQQLKIQRQIENARKKLYEQEIGSHLNYLTASDKRLKVEREFRQLQHSIASLRGEIEALRAEKQAFVSEWFSKIGLELSEATKQRDSKLEELVKLRRKRSNIQITAPADGTIISFSDLFVGAIVSEGATVMSLVPSNVPLNVEMDIDPRDIGNLVVGAPVSVKLDALPYQKHGDLAAEITFISEDTVNKSLDGQPGTFYRAHATIKENQLRDTPDNFRLVPGMLLTGDIRAGKRRLITYFIYPVIRTIDTSFAEPGR